MMQALKATGVVRGFNARAEGSCLIIGPGLAYCDGEEIAGGWRMDFAGNADGWQSAGINGLPLYAVLLSGDAVAAVRDLRRWVTCAVRCGSGQVLIGLGGHVVLQRMATALRIQDARTQRLVWYPLPVGTVTATPHDGTLTLNVKAPQGREAAVVVEYTLSSDNQGASWS